MKTYIVQTHYGVVEVKADGHDLENGGLVLLADRKTVAMFASWVSFTIKAEA